MLNTKNKQTIVILFVFSLSVGLVFDTLHKYDKYGWEYEVTYMIENDETTSNILTIDAIGFTTIFCIISLLSISVLLDLEKIQNN